jgi:hypothetical protein
MEIEDPIVGHNISKGITLGTAGHTSNYLKATVEDVTSEKVLEPIALYVEAIRQ